MDFNAVVVYVIEMSQLQQLWIQEGKVIYYFVALT